MDKLEFLAIFRTERAIFEKYLMAVGLSRMDVPGVSGFYSMKDIVAHLEAYDRALVIWLKESKAGRTYVDPILDQPDLNARNEVVYKANKDRDAEDVIATFKQTLAELEALIESLTDDELIDADSTAWFVEPRWQYAPELWKCIANDSYEHQQQHLPDIERWLHTHGSIGG
jgi:hypothetical protein